MNALPSAPRGETLAHRRLKRLALLWAQAQGFRIAALEVALPRYRVRMDVAAYRAERARVPQRDAELETERLVWKPKIGVTAIFECKSSRLDFLRDAQSMKMTLERLEALHDKRRKAEQELKLHYPSIRNGDSLFQEYETLDFGRPGYERYERVLREMRQLSGRLHGNTKFDRLARYGAANLFYVVAEPGVVFPHALPCGWGLLEREGEELALRMKPHWHDAAEEDRLHFLHRISMAATRAVNREQLSERPAASGQLE
jgi:hypothetical protein